MPETKDVWGPREWMKAHHYAIAYPDAPSAPEKIRGHLWLWGWIQGLPCPECLSHATEYARRFPPRLDSSSSLQTWLWKMHNAVNRRLGKPEMSPVEYRQVYGAEIREKFCRMYGDCI